MENSTIHNKFFTKEFLKDVLLGTATVAADPHWLTHAIPYIAVPRPPKASTQALVDELSSDKEYSVNGHLVSSDIIRLIYQIVGTIERSKILPKHKDFTQTKKPQYSAAVPWILYAYKFTHGIEYDKWILDHEKLNDWVLGTSLKDYFKIRAYLMDGINHHEYEIDSEAGEIGLEEWRASNGIITPENIYPLKTENRIQYREKSIYDPIKEEYVSPLDFKLVKNRYTGGRLSSQNIPKFYWHMLTQTWIFDPSIRTPNMVTSFESLSTIDPPLVATTVREVISDVPWN
jgi:hypothetical protein